MQNYGAPWSIRGAPFSVETAEEGGGRFLQERWIFVNMEKLPSFRGFISEEIVSKW